MRGNITALAILLLIFLSIDVYVFQAFRYIGQSLSPTLRKSIYIIYWTITILTLIGFLSYNLGNPEKWSRFAKTMVFSSMMVIYFSKLFVVLFLLVDDVVRLIRWMVYKIQSVAADQQPANTSTPISRHEFLVKAGLIVGSLPFISMAYGIIAGAHDYTIRRVTIRLKKLPIAFDGLRIAQLSDIHAGSFYNKFAVERGIQMLLNEKPDVVFFTGDLVNDRADEMVDYKDVFAKVKAPMGVYSVLGNHDYGDYVQWPSAQAKSENLKRLINIHKEMGWDILINENRKLEKDGESIAIIGVENWGAKGRFPKYGKLSKAYKGIEDTPVKLLLSHDPSHWDAEVRQKYKDIDIMFSGHTHGFQFGVEIANVKWSPVKYMYEQWAGLYQKGEQFLYVNRGFGYIGYPGRVGITPEITIIELKSDMS
ncbi:MAG TPA: metallophosphoesterase [Cytophagaceae bacterium]